MNVSLFYFCFWAKMWMSVLIQITVNLGGASTQMVPFAVNVHMGISFMELNV